MVAAASGAQAAPNAGSNMLVQLLESQRFEGVSLLADEDKVRPEQDNTDVTEWIVNPDFSDGMNGWNTGGMPYDEGYLTNDGMPYMYSDGVHGYNRTFDFTQNLTGIPNGAYSLSVQIISSAGVPTVTLHLNSSIEKAEYGIGQDRIEIATSIEAWADDQDANRVTTSEVLVVDGNLTMGINRHNGREGYLYFDNFRLTYVNDGADKAQEIYKAKVTELRDATTYPAGLEERVTTAKAEKTITADNFQTEYAALEAEVDFLNSSAVSDLKSAMDSYTSIAGSLNDGVKQAVEDAIAKANTDIADVTDVENVASITENLTEAFKTAIAGSEVVWVETNFDNNTADGWNGVSTAFGSIFLKAGIS